MAEAGFVQAGIKIQQPREFEQLRSAVERVLASAAAESFLRKLKARGVRVRQWEAVLGRGVMEELDPALAGSGTTARALYEALPVSDQAQMREFYLTKVEQMDARLRDKFGRLFETY